MEQRWAEDSQIRQASVREAGALWRGCVRLPARVVELISRERRAKEERTSRRAGGSAVNLAVYPAFRSLRLRT